MPAGRGRAALARLHHPIFAGDRGASWCRERIERIRAVDTSAWTDLERIQIHSSSVRCYVGADDCAAALDAFVEFRPFGATMEEALASFDDRWERCREASTHDTE
ncbi:MAG: hypothetical protein KTR31_31090 [Myxococcales bacterium]|nr:hypothetical protein [Myxococcales bacterium]